MRLAFPFEWLTKLIATKSIWKFTGTKNVNFVFSVVITFYSALVQKIRHLDTSLINVDLESNYVRVTIKGKIFQISLRDEIRIEKSTSQRSMTTGHLLIVMPKLSYKAPIQMEKKSNAIRRDGEFSIFRI